MKISKPFPLSLQVRPYRWRGQSRIGLSIIVLVDASELVPVIESEQKLWELANTELDSGGVIEYGIPKVNPEFLVSGKAYSNFSKDKTKVDLTVRVNDLVRQLRVFGEREYIDKKITNPKEFKEIPLTWANSYGGEGFENNPMGKGYIKKNDEQSNEPIILPNIENPNHLIVELRDEYKSYNFGPQSMVWPVRFGKVGTYSEEWKKRDFPGFFSDMDPTMFNAAQDDQIFKNLDCFPNNTNFSVINMHPEKEVWKGIIPAWSGRCLVKLQKTPDHEAEVIDVSLKLKTLWLVPHLEKYILIFQESIPSWFDDGTEIIHVLASLEWGHSPKPADHYMQFMSLREDHYTSALKAFSDEDLLPENVKHIGFDSEPAEVGELTEKLLKFQDYVKKITREHINEIGLDGSYYLPQEVGPQPRSNLKFLNEKQKWQDERVEQLRNHFNDVKAARKRYVLSKGVDKEFDELTRANELYEFATSDLKNIKQNPNLEDTKLSKLQEMYSEENSDQRIDKLKKKMWSLTAQFDQGEYLINSLARKVNRDGLIEMIAKAESVEGIHLTDADLSKLEFENIDFSFAIFKGTNLTGCRFIKCKLNEAAFSFAILNNVVFDDCEFLTTNFNQAKFDGSYFKNCKFEKLVIFEYSFFKCQFESCYFKEILAHQSTFLNCKFKECVHDGFSMVQSSYKDCEYLDCEWQRCAYTECSIENCDFNKNYFYRFALTLTDIENSSFKSSWLEALSVISDNPLVKIDFTECYIKNSSLRKQNFRGCIFNNSIIENSELSHSSFVDIDMTGIEVPDSLFRHSKFSKVDFTNSNLMTGTFTHSIFSEVNFTHVNFFRCEMGHTIIKDDCIEHENYMELIQLEPTEGRVSDAS